jgi:short-subunit dehydrogenase involved in D-alanine esterification of teichoic acids
MPLTGNTILVNTGGTGIGRGLAESFHRLGNDVLVAGWRSVSSKRFGCVANLGFTAPV